MSSSQLLQLQNLTMQRSTHLEAIQACKLQVEDPVKHLWDMLGASRLHVEQPIAKALQSLMAQDSTHLEAVQAAGWTQ